MTLGIDFGLFWEVFWYHFLYFFVTLFFNEFSIDLSMDFSANLVPKDDARRVQKLNSPRLFPRRLLLGHPGPEKGALETHFGSLCSQKVFWMSFGCSYVLVCALFLKLLAGEQHCGDKENMDK